MQTNAGLAVKSAAKRIPGFSLAYRTLRDLRFFWREPEMTDFGFRLTGSRVMMAGEHEADLMQLTRSYLQESSVFVDVGANIGLYCCLALSMGVPTIAFEPVPLNLRYLLRNIYANGWKDSCEVFPVALGGASGIVEMYGGGTGASVIKGWAQNSSLQKRLVPLMTLDRLIREKVENTKSLILVDVEGAEDQVIAGAEAVLTLSPRPVWIVEISLTEQLPHRLKTNPTAASTFQRFWDHGYDSWTTGKDIRRVEKDELLRVLESGADTIGTHNFLFLESGRLPLGH